MNGIERRLRALEAAEDAVEVPVLSPKAWAGIERAAAAFGLDLADMIAETERQLRRCGVIGYDAWVHEIATAHGTTVEDLMREARATAEEWAA